MNVSGGVPPQSPVDAESVEPGTPLPAIAGASLLTGGAAATARVGFELAVTRPRALTALTATRSVAPTSAGLSA